jgi:hypothetical protein
MPTQEYCAGSLLENGIKDERRCTMLDNEVKVIERPSSSSMPTLTETPNEGELPIEVVLAILYSQAKDLEKRPEVLAQVLTGHTPKGEPVTYIRMIGVVMDKERGLVLASVGNEA